MEDDDEGYDFDLRRHKRYNKSYPVSLAVKLVVAIGMIFIMWLIIEKLSAASANKPSEDKEKKIEIRL